MTPITSDQVLQMLRDLKQDPTLELAPEESLFDSGVLDSFGVIALIPKLDDLFGFQPTDAQLTPENFSSLLSITLLLNTR